MPASATGHGNDLVSHPGTAPGTIRHSPGRTLS
jgi:hypothetical protein